VVFYFLVEGASLIAAALYGYEHFQVYGFMSLLSTDTTVHFKLLEEFLLRCSQKHDRIVLWMRTGLTSLKSCIDLPERDLNRFKGNIFNIGLVFIKANGFNCKLILNYSQLHLISLWFSVVNDLIPHLLNPSKCSQVIVIS
jgi:hypothetical protein